MKKSNRFILYIVFSLIFGSSYYLITEKIIISIIVFVLFVLFFVILVEIKYKKYNNIKNKTKESFMFINNFVITYSINNSLSTTLESLSNGFSDDLNEQFSLIDHLSDEEKIYYLSNYFETTNYSLFVNLLKQHILEGGNIISYTKMLIFDLQIENDELENYISLSRQKIFQFSSMWAICFAILISIKFFMRDYFIKIQKMSYFPYGVLVFYIVFMISLYLIISNSLNLDFIDRSVINEK